MEQTLRDLVWQRAGGQCEYCQMPQQFDLLPFQIDHIIARQHRGRHVPDNLALACLACNNHKGPNIAGIDHATGGIVRLFDPRKDIWAGHFAWHGPELVGLTAVGKATVYVLGINLRYRRELRRGLIIEGVFPPMK
jgi:hypothetical protein